MVGADVGGEASIRAAWRPGAHAVRATISAIATVPHEVGDCSRPPEGRNWSPLPVDWRCPNATSLSAAGLASRPLQNRCVARSESRTEGVLYGPKKPTRGAISASSRTTQDAHLRARPGHHV